MVGTLGCRARRSRVKEVRRVPFPGRGGRRKKPQVKGQPCGLHLSAEDKRVLLGFLGRWDVAVRTPVWMRTPLVASELGIDRSSKDAARDFPGNISKPEIAAGVTVSHFRVVQPHQVENRGVVVVNMNWMGRNCGAVLIRLTVGDAAFDAGAGKQRREALRPVIAAF